MSAKGKDAEIFNLGAILLNIPGQEYVFGRMNTPESPGEHFILCPFPNVEIRHCKISVDDEGEFWIEDLSSNSAKTSINREPLPSEGKKKLSFGDNISLQGIETTAFVYFEFEEHQQDQKKKLITPFPAVAIDVGNNHVLVKLILEHFSVKELKEYRFISKPWDSAASQLLRKHCAVTIPASRPHERTKLFQCAEEMKVFATNMTSVSVEIPKFSIGEKDTEKFLQDLVKYHLKESLKYFKVSALRLSSSSEIVLLDKVLQKVSQHCPKLGHLALSISFEGERPHPYRYSQDSDSDWSFGPNLKIFEVFEDWTGFEFARRIWQKIDTTKLEKFSSRKDSESSFSAVLHENNFLNLKEISLSYVTGVDLGALVNLTLPSNALQKLVLNDVHATPGLSSVLNKFSKSLVSLTMDCCQDAVVLPSFEKLEVLSLVYDDYTRLTFPQNFLYSKHFPKLKSLTLRSRKMGERDDGALSNYTKEKALAQWGVNQGVFNAFITNGQVCSSLVKLFVPHCPPEERGKNKEYSDRLKGMRTLFPNVKGKWIKAGK